MNATETSSRTLAPLRSTRPQTYLVLFAVFALILGLAHSPFFELPFFWDELGQFVPAALDLYRHGALVPQSAVPNVHPPGVMAWLAATWSITGYSIPSTRAAMLAMAALGALFCFLLAIQLSRGLGGAPAFFAVLLLLLDPLFYTQSMMAQLDMPAMVFSLAGLLFFLSGRHRSAGLVCTALVLVKETGILLPLILAGALLLQRGHEKQAVYYAPPFVVLAAWLALLWHSTGHIFGDPGFAQYNINYSLHPVRAGFSLLRRLYYIFVADFRWAGTLAILAAWRARVFRGPGWRVAAIFAAAHVVLVSLLGGAELERYLLPALPLFYMAVAASWTALRPAWRNASLAVMTFGLLAGLFINPGYPFPFENNLAMVDFVELHRTAAEFLEQTYPTQAVYTAWPLTAALRTPEFGYVHRGLIAKETSDLHFSTLSRLDPGQVHVLVLYSRTWEPGWGLLNYAWPRKFVAHFYDYEPQMTAAQCRDILGLQPVVKWTRRGQWIEVFAERPEGRVFPVARRK